MAKKDNPWTKALKKKKAPVDLHPDVLRAVLRVNPSMRGGDRSTEQVAEGLMADLPGMSPASPPTDLSPEARHALLESMALLSQDLGADLRDLERARAELDARENATRQRYVDRLVDLVHRHNPGGLGTEVRELLQAQADLRRRLRLDVADIARLVTNKKENA